MHRVEPDLKYKRDEKELQKVARAQREMIEYLKLSPDSPRRFDARYYMAVAQIKLGQRDAGEKQLRALTAGGPDAPDLKSELAKMAAGLLADLRAGRVE